MKPHNLITVYVIQYIRMYPTVSKILKADNECEKPDCAMHRVIWPFSVRICYEDKFSHGVSYIHVFTFI